jgi:hypothetical protein
VVFCGELLVNYGALDGLLHASKIYRALKVYFLWTMRAGVEDDWQGSIRAMGRDGRQ